MTKTVAETAKEVLKVGLKGKTPNKGVPLDGIKD
jgi:hypothetical protein